MLSSNVNVVVAQKENKHTKEKNNKLFFLQRNSPGCNRARLDYAPHVYRSRACICFCWRYLVKIFGIQRCIDCCCSTLFQLCLPVFGRRVDVDFSRWLELNRFFFTLFGYFVASAAFHSSLSVCVSSDFLSTFFFSQTLLKPIYFAANSLIMLRRGRLARDESTKNTKQKKSLLIQFASFCRN